MQFHSLPHDNFRDYDAIENCFCDCCGREYEGDRAYFCAPCHKRAIAQAERVFAKPVMERMRHWCRSRLGLHKSL